MLVQCPRCQTKYNLDESVIPAEGSNVQCSRCSHQFRVEAPAAAQVLQLTDALPAEAEETPPPPPPPAMGGGMDFLDEDGPAAGGLGFDDDFDDDEESGGGGVVKKILVTLIILILIALLAVGGLVYLKFYQGLALDEDYLGIDLTKYIPMVEMLRPAAETEPQPQTEPDKPAREAKPTGEPGNKRIHLSGVKGRFVDLPNADRIFVLSGQVKNAYGYPVSEIKLRGLLHTKEQRNAVDAVVFSGHVLTDQELKSLSRSVIEGILGSPVDKDGAELGLATGESIDFMIVFFDLPENLVEFTVEVVSSKRSAE